MDVSDTTEPCTSFNECKTAFAKPVRSLLQKNMGADQILLHVGSRRRRIKVEPHKEKNLENAYMAYVGEIPKTIEYIAVFTSGQQIGARPSIISGTNGKYDKEKKHDIDPESLAGRFFRCEQAKSRKKNNKFCFDQKKTLQLSIFDNKFDYTKDERKHKVKLLSGYSKFLRKAVKGQERDLKAIYLAGGSRGGCLVLRLAEDLMWPGELQHVKFIVHSFDGVCNHWQEEFGTSHAAIHNPKNWWHKGQQFDIKKQFKKKYRKRLCMRHIVDGEATSIIAFPFAQKGCGEPEPDSCRLPLPGRRRFTTRRRRRIYYEQKWLNFGHGSHLKILGQWKFETSPIWSKEYKIDHSFDSETVKPMMKHFIKCKTRLDII